MEIEEVLKERAKTHGVFEIHAFLVQEIKIVMMSSGNWHKLKPFQKEALEMAAHKIGRILAGNPNEPDHWLDIAGYAKLVANILEGKGE